MMKILKSLIVMLVSSIITLNGISFNIYAEAVEKPSIIAKAAILIEQETGKVLFAKDENKKMFPASTTKLMTAMIALDHLSPGELIVVGKEIYTVPNDSSKGGHIVGETISVENLIRGLIIPSGNDTSCVVALAVARKVSENDDIPYSEAEKLFSKLMNEKAKEIGAKNTNFANPHGYHNESHYSTAYDMALIAQAAIKYKLIKEISAEPEYVGNGAGNINPESYDPPLVTQDYKNWRTHNMLLVPGQFYYEYATGLKTGFMDEAGYCLVGSATKDNKNYISVVLFSTEEGRWTDTVKIFEYGFEAYNTEIVQEKDTPLGEVKIANPRLGDSGVISVYSSGEFSAFMSKEELSRVNHKVEYNKALIYTDADSDENATPKPPTDEMVEANDEILFAAPITKGQVIGRITYYLDDELLFTSNVLSRDEALKRTFNTDVDYNIAQFKAWLFSINSIPYILSAIATITLLIVAIVSIKRRRRRNRRTLRKRY